MPYNGGFCALRKVPETGGDKRGPMIDSKKASSDLGDDRRQNREISTIRKKHREY